MKVCLIVFIMSLSLQASSVSFNQIFKEIKDAKTSTESIKVREKYLNQMEDLNDFDRLSDLEALNEGEYYFDHYRKAISRFIVNNVGEFMLDKGSDYEREIYARNIISKSYGESMNLTLLKKGLFYVRDCESFKSYISMSAAPREFSERYNGKYCHGTQGYAPTTFELISNIKLQDGEYKTIYLPSFMYVSKVYISVEGYRSSTFFDVMVNGDAKGTIYAPGRDPLYIVNISEATNAIQLRSLGGAANIISIKVETR